MTKGAMDLVAEVKSQIENLTPDQWQKSLRAKTRPSLMCGSQRKRRRSEVSPEQ